MTKRIFILFTVILTLFCIPKIEEASTTDSSLVILIENIESGAPVIGARILITYEGEEPKEYLSGQDGIMRAEDLKAGTINVQLVEVPEHYIFEDISFTKEIEEGEIYTDTIRLNHKKGNLHIKSNAKNAYFMVDTPRWMSFVQTDDKGEVYVENLYTGVFTVVQQPGEGIKKTAETVNGTILENYTTEIEMICELEEIKQDPEESKEEETKKDEESEEEDTQNPEDKDSIDNQENEESGNIDTENKEDSNVQKEDSVDDKKEIEDNKNVLEENAKEEDKDPKTDEDIKENISSTEIKTESNSKTETESKKDTEKEDSKAEKNETQKADKNQEDNKDKKEQNDHENVKPEETKEVVKGTKEQSKTNLATLPRTGSDYFEIKVILFNSLIFIIYIISYVIINKRQTKK